MRSPLPAAVLGSLVTHAVLAGAGALAIHMLVRPAPPPPPDGVELEIVAPPPPSPPPASAPPAPAALARAITPPPPELRPNTPQRVREPTHRVLVAPGPTAPEVGTIEPPPVEPPEPSNAPPSSAPAERPRLSAAELMGSAGLTASAAAAAGVIDPGHPGQRPPGWRDLWGQGNRPTGTPEERARAAAMAPITAALEGANHMQPAGAVTHDRRVARRVIEELDPVHTVPNLGAAVLRAPSVTIPAQQRVAGGGEAQAAADFDMRQGSQFAGMTLGGQMPAMSYRLVRAEIEVEQDSTGAITNVRVSRRSGVAAFDEAASRAIRLAIPQGQPLVRDHGRRSRWSFEVSEQQGPGLTLTGGNQGWTELPGESNGVHLRMRVRMVGATTL